MSYQGHQGGGQYGEAASYYGEPHNASPYGPPSGGQPAYGQPYASQYGDIYDERGGGSPHPPQGAGGPGQDGERGLMGGLAGGVAGAYGGHKMGHGVLGAIGGAFAGHKLQDFVQDKKEERHEEKIQHEQQSYGTPPPGYSSQGPYHAPSPHHSESHHHHHSPIPTHHDRSISGGGGGNFSASSYDIHLEGHDLRATCRRTDGGTQVSIMNLNAVLSNEDGHFRWVAGGSGGGASVTVMQGDTLRNIAGRVGCNFEDLARRNNLANPDMIYPGQVLSVPGGGAVGNFGASARDVRLVDGGRVLEAELMDTGGHWRRSHINLDERIGNENGRLTLV
ncbi:hypothetical protein SLS62_006374 [Diatrype stigma]|uniref:LysM domain-containing protein n=1 Tax=Diatrype stigma TaxID=117547 RepID=A0AAN9YMV2_9PEZI